MYQLLSDGDDSLEEEKSSEDSWCDEDNNIIKDGSRLEREKTRSNTKKNVIYTFEQVDIFFEIMTWHMREDAYIL